MGAKSFTGNPYDGHTLAAQMKQVRSMIGDRVGEAHVDMGYRGHDYEGPVTVHVDKRSRGRTPTAAVALDETPRRGRAQHRTSEERTPVGAEPAEGRYGDAINAMLAAAAMNFHKLLGAFWLYFLRRLLGIWGQFQLMRGFYRPAGVM